MTYNNALQTYIEATNTHDFSQVRQILHPDAVYWFSNKTCTTWDEIQAYFENTWNVIKEEVYEARDVTWIVSKENSATCLYTYHWQGYHKGKFASGFGRATNVFIRDEQGEWKLIHEHLSAI